MREGVGVGRVVGPNDARDLDGHAPGLPAAPPSLLGRVAVRPEGLATGPVAVLAYQKVDPAIGPTEMTVRTATGARGVVLGAPVLPLAPEQVQDGRRVNARDVLGLDA